MPRNETSVIKISSTFFSARALAFYFQKVKSWEWLIPGQSKLINLNGECLWTVESGGTNKEVEVKNE